MCVYAYMMYTCIRVCMHVNVYIMHVYLRRMLATLTLLVYVRAAETHFGFLFDMDSPDGRYYRWKVFSLAMGDELETYRTSPFQMTPNGPWWIPPELARERRWVSRGALPCSL